MTRSKLMLMLLLALQCVAVSAGRVRTDSVKSQVLGAWVKYNVYLLDGFGRPSACIPSCISCMA